MEKSFVTGSWQQSRAFSPAVITKGEQTTAWLAGHTGAATDDGQSLAGDFDAQFSQTFRNIERTLSQCGCKLADIVTMTVFLIDARLHHSNDRAAGKAVWRQLSGKRGDHCVWFCPT